VNQKTYYTIRICKRGELPLDRPLGHHFEHNYAEIDEALDRLPVMRQLNPDYHFHLLKTTSEVIDTQGEINT